MAFSFSSWQKNKDKLKKDVQTLSKGLSEVAKKAPTTPIKKSAQSVPVGRETRQFPGVPVTKIITPPVPKFNNTTLKPDRRVSVISSILEKNGVNPTYQNIKNTKISDVLGIGNLKKSVLKPDNRSVKQKQEDAERTKEYYNMYNTQVRHVKSILTEAGNGLLGAVIGIASGFLIPVAKSPATLVRAVMENIDTNPYGQLDMFNKRSLSEEDQRLEEYSAMKGDTEDVYYDSFVSNNPLYKMAMKDLEFFDNVDSWLGEMATKGKSKEVVKAYELGRSSGSFLATLGATFITKNPTALATFGTALDSFDTYNEARKTEGPSGSFISLSADVAGTFALEKLGWEALMKSWSKPLAKQISEKVPFFKNISLKAPVATSIAGNAVASGVTEGVQEVAQTVWQNAVAKYGYDHTRNIMDGVVESFLIGGFLGGASTAVVQTKQAIEDKDNINKAKEELKSKLGINDDQALKMASYLHSFTRTESGMLKNKMDSMFREKRVAGYKGLEDAGARPGIDIPGELPVPEAITTAPVEMKESEYKPPRKIPEKQAYGNSSRFIETDYHGERVTTDGVLLEFNSTVKATVPANPKQKVISQDSIERIIPNGDLKDLNTRAVYSNGTWAGGKALDLVWLGEKNSKAGEGPIINRKIFDYLKGKYPDVTFKSTGENQQPVVAFSKDKIVALVSPMYSDIGINLLTEESKLIWRSPDLTGNVNIDNIQSDTNSNKDDTSSRKQVPTVSGVPTEQSGGLSENNSQPSQSGPRAPSRRERILGADRKRSGTYSRDVNKKAKELLESGKNPEDFTADEIELLKNYSGMGGSGESGRGLLDEYYTPVKVIDKMWALARKHGFTGGAVLEPSAGVGRFIHRGPENVKYTALEIDNTSSKIAQITLKGKAEVKQMPFENLFITESGKKVNIETTYDLIIGNPPYGEHRGYYKGLGEESKIAKYEDYFIKRSLDLAKEDGLVVMIVPSGFLKTTTSYAKKQIASSGELMEAYRLPEKIFDKTSIGTDILVFKKSSTPGDEVIERRVETLTGDNYFKENKGKILGDVKERKSRFGRMEAYVTGSEDVLDKIEVTAEQDNGPKVFQEVVEKNVDEEKKSDEIQEQPKPEAKVEEYSLREETGQMFSTMHLTEADKNIWRNKTVDGSIKTKNLTGEEINTLNVFNGKYYDDFDYLQGNIYEKLDALDREDISPEKKEEQRAKLEKILPQKKKIENIYINPIGEFASNFKIDSVNYKGETESISLKSEFQNYLRTLPRDAFAPSDMWETMGYVRGDRVNTRGDKILANTIKQRRKHVAEKLFPKFIESLDSETKKTIEDQFNREKNGFVSPDFKKVPLFVDGLDMTFGGRGLKIGEYKIDSIGFLSNRGTGINANGVGLGKTMMAIISTAQDVQKGWYKRPLFIVPKGVYKKWIEEIQLLFPKQKVVGLGNLGVGFGVKSADDIKAKIKDGDFTIMTYEALSQLGFNKETQEGLLSEINNAYTELGKKKSKRDKEIAITTVHDISGKAKIMADIKIEDLGFDNLVVDEAHNFKNIFSRAKENTEKDNKSASGRWGGITGSSSERGLKMWLLSQYIQKKNEGRGVKLLTATPFTNNPLEFYNVLSLVAMKEMKAMGIDNINTFMDTFLKTTKKYVVKSGGKYEMADVVETWQNKDILTGLIKRFVDFKDGEDYGVVRPNKVKKDHRFNTTKLQLEYLAKAQELLDPKNLAKGGALVYIDEAKKITLSPYLSRYYNGPLPTAKEFVENSPKLMGLMTMLKANKKQTGQVIYYPLEVDQMPLLKQYLVDELKYKPAEVGIIHGKIGDTVREKVKKGFNDGKIKVIIGSDAIKEGVDLQTRSTDLYITSYPWRPTDLVQVEGRIHRQGNIYQSVRINYLSLRDSVDSFLFQKLDTKAKRLASADALTQTLEGDDMDYESMTADLITDPAFKLQVKTAMKTEKINAKINGIKSEIALLQDQNKKLNNATADLKYTEEWLNDPTNQGSWNMDSYKKTNTKAKKILKTFEDRGVSLEINEAKISELEKVLEATKEKASAMAESLKEEAKNLPALVEMEEKPNDYKTLEEELIEENKTFIKIKEKESDQPARADSSESKVLPSVVNAINSGHLPLQGVLESSDPTISKTQGVEDKSMKKILSSQRTNFVSEFDMGFGLLNNNIIAHYYDVVKSVEPEFVNILDKIKKETNSEGFIYRKKTEESLMSKQERGVDRGRTLGTSNDTLGGTIITDKADDVLDYYHKSYPEEQINTDDFRNKPNMWGYTGIHLNKELSNGLWTEIQIHSRKGLYNKEYAHEIYNKWRDVVEPNLDLDVEGFRKILKPDEYIEFEKDLKFSQSIFKNEVEIPQRIVEMVDKIIADNKTQQDKNIADNRLILDPIVETVPTKPKKQKGSVQTMNGLKDVTVEEVNKDLSIVNIEGTEALVESKNQETLEESIKEVVKETEGEVIPYKEGDVVEVAPEVFSETETQEEQAVVVVAGSKNSVIETSEGFKVVENSKTTEVLAEEEAPKPKKRKLKIANEDVAIEDLPPAIPTNEELLETEGPDDGTVDLNLTKFDRFRILVQERAVGLEKAQKIMGEGENVQEDMDMYMEYELYSGALTAHIEKFEKETWKPLQDELIKFTSLDPSHSQLIQNYLWYSHAEERNKNHYDGASGIETKEAKRLLKEMQKLPQFQEIQRIAKQFQSLAKKLPEYLYENGMIKQKEFDDLKTLYKNYVPLQRILPDNGDFSQALGIGKGFDTRGKDIKRAKGSDLEVANILESIRLNWERAIIRVHKNNVGKTVYKFAKNYSKLSLFKLVRGKVKLMEVDGEIIRTIEPPSGDNIFTVKIDGVQKYIKIMDPTVATVLKNLDSQAMNAAARTLAGFTRFYSMINTSLNPEFIISNAIKDIQTASLNTSKEFGLFGMARNAKIFPQAYKGVFDALKGEETPMAKLYNQMKELGGTTGYFNLSNREDIARKIQEGEEALALNSVGKLRQGGRKILDFIDFINEVVENGTRLAVFKVALDQGFSPKKSAQLAKNATVNFNKHGTLGPTMNMIYAFSNASVQGSANVIKTLSNPKSFAKITTLISTISVLLQAWNRAIDEDEYDKIDSYIKETNWVIMIGGGHYLKLGLPYGYNVIKVMADNVYELSIGKTVPMDSFTSVAGAMLSAYNPIGGNNFIVSAFPTIVRPIAEVAINKGWHGGNIAPMNLTGAKASLNYSDTENPIFVNIAKYLSKYSGGSFGRGGAIELSPASIEYLWNQYSGGVGRFLMGNAKTVVNLAKSPEEIETKDIPFWRKVVGKVDVPRYNTNYIYDTIEKAGKVPLTEDQKAEFIRVLKEEGEAGRLTMKDAKGFLKKAKNAQEDLSQTRKVVDYIEKQNWNSDKIDQFMEKLLDNKWTKEQGLGTFTKTQVKMIRQEL